MEPPPSSGFTVLRVPLRDVDEEDISAHFHTAINFISSAFGATRLLVSSCQPELPTRAAPPKHSTTSKACSTQPAEIAASCPPTSTSTSNKSSTAPKGSGAQPDTGHGSSGQQEGGVTGSAAAQPQPAPDPASKATSHAVGSLSQPISHQKGVLVHCSEGKSRSVTLVVAYMVVAQRKPLANALQLVRCACVFVVDQRMRPKHELKRQKPPLGVASSL